MIRINLLSTGLRFKGITVDNSLKTIQNQEAFSGNID
jgi:hypothetical protein